VATLVAVGGWRRLSAWVAGDAGRREWLATSVGVGGMATSVDVGGMATPVGVGGMATPVGVGGMATPVGVGGMATPVGVGGDVWRYGWGEWLRCAINRSRSEAHDPGLALDEGPPRHGPPETVRPSGKGRGPRYRR